MNWMDYTPADNMGECVADCFSHNGDVNWQILQPSEDAPKDVFISLPEEDFFNLTVGGFPIPLLELKAIVEEVILITTNPLFCNPTDTSDVLDLARRLLLTFQEYELQIERSN